MKWYITEPAPVADGTNTVKIVRKEMGSEAAGIALKWPSRPSVKRVIGQQEVPNYVPAIDDDGSPILDEFGEPTFVQDGTRLEDIVESVDYPYLVLDGETLRAATDDERDAIDAALAAKDNTRTLGLADAYGADVAILGRLLVELGFTMPCDPAEVIQTIKGGLATGVIDLSLAPKADSLKGIYDELKKAMTDDEIVAVAQILAMQTGGSNE